MESRPTPCTRREPSPRSGRRVGAIFVGILVLALAGGIFRRMGLGSYFVQRAEYSRKAETFADTSESLKQTVIVPTLDTPCPSGKNVIWCSSFQLAWNEVRDKIIEAPLEVLGSEQIATRLNAAKQSVSDVDAASVYVAAGRIRKGIIETIEKEMAAKFPSRVLPDFNDYAYEPGGILAYSYLAAHVPFKYPFRQVDEGIPFTDSQGIQTPVAGFGLWMAFLQRYKDIREQVEVLYAREDQDHSEELKECALDLCRHSKPYQVVVARVEPKSSLAETLEYIRARTVEFKKSPFYEEDRRLGGNDELRVPDMFWRIDHRFQELIGKMVANSKPPMPIVEALQTIEFRLDRSGAILESDSTLVVEASTPRHFEFNRPFLVYMQKRDAEHPFFVMWVDNAELLARK